MRVGMYQGEPMSHSMSEVVGEEVAVFVQGDVVVVAEADRVDLVLLRHGIEAGSPAAGSEASAGVATGIPHAGEEEVLGPGDDAGAGEELAGGRIGEIPAAK